MSDKNKKFKCPYCKVKNYYGAQNCVNCNLDFRQLGNLSNKEAKKAIKEKLWGESLDGIVINTSTFPYDKSKWKTFFMCLFLGFFGAHNFYVGKYKKGWAVLVLSIIFVPFFLTGLILGYQGVAVAITNLGFINFYLIGAIFATFPTINWLLDILFILINRFELPVKLKKNIDLPSKNYKEKK